MSPLMQRIRMTLSAFSDTVKEKMYFKLNTGCGSHNRHCWEEGEGDVHKIINFCFYYSDLFPCGDK
jgi:hypothetical protein